MLFRIGLLLCLSAGPLAARAAEPLLLDTIEVSGSRLPDPYRVTTPSHTRRDRTAIDRLTPADSAELLRSAPGVDVAQSGGAGGLSYVSVRGGDPNFTLFLLDGIRLNDPTNSRGGGVDLYMIPRAIVDSVEILPGPVSALRGSDGLSGVVNFRTRRTDGAQWRAGLTQHGGGEVTASVGGRPAPWLAAGVTLGHEDRDSGVEHDLLRQDYLQGYLSAGRADDFDLDVVLFHGDGEAHGFPEDSGGDRLAVVREAERRDYRRSIVGLGADWDLDPAWSLSLSASWGRLEEATDNPGIAAGLLPAVPALSGERDYEQVEGQLYLRTELPAGLSLSAGVGYQRERGSTADSIDFGGFAVPASFDLRRSVRSSFFEAGYQAGPGLLLQAGVRHDDPEGFDDEILWRLSAAYSLSGQDLTLTLSYAEGLKLPSLFALGHSLIGNPGLQPETSESLELGLAKSWPARGLDLGLTLYRVEYRDLIDFDPLLFSNVNRGLVEGRGVEGRVGWRPAAGLSLTAHLTYNDTDVVGSDVQLRRRPVWKGGLSAEWLPRPRWSWVTSAVYTGSFVDSSIVTGPVGMPSFWRLDSALRWRHSASLTAGFGIKNLLDDDYEESVGFSNGGATAMLEVLLTL